MDKKVLKVLMVEDCETTQKLWEIDLNSKLVILSAFSIKEAEEKFTANPDIVAIVLDACVSATTPDTPPLVRKFRKTFTGPMIATSGSLSYRGELVDAGCNFSCDKDNVPQNLLKVLGF